MVPKAFDTELRIINLPRNENSNEQYYDDHVIAQTCKKRRLYIIIYEKKYYILMKNALFIKMICVKN